MAARMSTTMHCSYTSTGFVCTRSARGVLDNARQDNHNIVPYCMRNETFEHIYAVQDIFT